MVMIAMKDKNVYAKRGGSEIGEVRSGQSNSGKLFWLA